MTANLRPRRSVLYMPGANARAMEKARTLPADALILDMEDAVAPDAKELARAQIASVVGERGFGRREVVVRVNGLATPWGRSDVQAVAGSGADAILFPKVEDPDEVLAAVAALDAAGAPGDLPVWIMAETPRAILRIDAIASAHPRLALIVMGTSDLAKEMRVRHTIDRIGLVPALSRCVLAARASGLDILDGVHLDLDDDAGLRSACEQGRALGFDGKTLIHPRQIPVANEVFAPGEGAVGTARRIIDAWSAAKSQGKGVVVVDGRLVENLHVDEARRTLAMHDAIRQLEA